VYNVNWHILVLLYIAISKIMYTITENKRTVQRLRMITPNMLTTVNVIVVVSAIRPNHTQTAKLYSYVVVCYYLRYFNYNKVQ